MVESHMAQWAMFFTWFDFKVTYLPGEKNIKADALSRQFDPPNASPQYEKVLSPTCYATPITWSQEETLRLANNLATAP